ncbi:ribonuclease P 40kDa subunit-domain-containing protein [Syncephalis fuscata]|nr:ribonuclease P 40kDa subunit-domain-containing protein [Syncephalis fuscata]
MSFKPSPTTTTTRTLITRSNLAWTRSRHERVIRDHYFNHALQVFLPTPRPPQPLPDWFAVGDVSIDGTKKDDAFYYDAKLPLTHFIEPDFITRYIRNGVASTVAISVGTHIDRDDVVALDASGRLILNVTKDTYEKLGLDGQPSRFSKQQPQRFVITLDLTLAAMKPGKKLYDRIRWCFENTFNEPVRFFIVHALQGKYTEMVFPASIRVIKRNLSRDAGLCRDLKIPTMASLHTGPTPLKTTEPAKDATKPLFTLSSRKRPRPSDKCENNIATTISETQLTDWESEAIEAREWLGMVACNADRMRLGEEVDPFVAVYHIPEPNEISDGYQCRWRGLITAEHIHCTLIGVW